MPTTDCIPPIELQFQRRSLVPTCLRSGKHRRIGGFWPEAPRFALACGIVLVPLAMLGLRSAQLLWSEL